MSVWRGDIGQMIRCLFLIPAIAALCGCTEPPSVALDMSQERVVYYESTDPDTVRAVEVYRAADGKELGYVRHYLPGAKAETALVYLHGIESHAAWFAEPADLLTKRGYDVYCLDRRGSGINRENRGFPSGDVDSYETLLSDIEAFIRPLRARYRRVFLVGLSWGGKLALAYGLTHPADCDGLVLITPGIRSRVDITPGQKLVMLLGSKTAPIPTPIEPEMFTKTPRFLERIQRDPLRLRYATVRFFLQSRKLDKYVDKRMCENRLPILLILAGQDRIVDNEGIAEVLARGAQETLDIRTYRDQTHSIQFDAPGRLVGDMVRWLERPQPANPQKERSRP